MVLFTACGSEQVHVESEGSIVGLTRHYDVAVHLPVSQKAKGNTNIWQK